MLAHYIITFSICWVSLNALSLNAQQYYYEDTHNSFNSKGVCTINGEVFYGIDCWCYSNKVGTVFITVVIVLLVVFFFINGCIWACLIKCYQNYRDRRNRDDEFRDIASIRSSMRARSSMRKRDIDT